MRTSMLVLFLAASTVAAEPSPSPSAVAATPATTAPARVAPDASDLAALDAYTRDPKNPEVLFDYFFSMLKLERYPDARRVLSEWRVAMPTDPRHGDVGGLLEKLEREPDPKKRDRIGNDWAIEQQRAARKQMDEIKSNMQKMGEGLKEMSREEANRGPAAIPQLKEKAEKEPTAPNWLAYSDALVASGDFKGALAAAQQAAAKDPSHALAAISVTQLQRFDGKNGEDIRKSLQKERINQVLKQLGP